MVTYRVGGKWCENELNKAPRNGEVVAFACQEIVDGEDAVTETVARQPQIRNNGHPPNTSKTGSHNACDQTTISLQITLQNSLQKPNS